MFVNWKVTKRTVCLPICCLKKVTARPQLCRLLCILISKAFCQKKIQSVFSDHRLHFRLLSKNHFTEQTNTARARTEPGYHLVQNTRWGRRWNLRTAQSLCLQPWTEQKHYLANDALGEVCGLGSDRSDWVGSSTHLAQVDGGIGVHCVDCFL